MVSRAKIPNPPMKGTSINDTTRPVTRARPTSVTTVLRNDRGPVAELRPGVRVGSGREAMRLPEYVRLTEDLSFDLPPPAREGGHKDLVLSSLLP